MLRGNDQYIPSLHTNNDLNKVSNRNSFSINFRSKIWFMNQSIQWIKNYIKFHSKISVVVSIQQTLLMSTLPFLFVTFSSSIAFGFVYNTIHYHDRPEYTRRKNDPNVHFWFSCWRVFDQLLPNPHCRNDSNKHL